MSMCIHAVIHNHGCYIVKMNKYLNFAVGNKEVFCVAMRAPMYGWYFDRVSHIDHHSHTPPSHKEKDLVAISWFFNLFMLYTSLKVFRKLVY